MKTPRRINGYPGTKELQQLLEDHGLNKYDVRLVSLIQEYETNKVGYSFRGHIVKLMENFEDTLSKNDLKPRFTKVTDTRGVIFLDKVEK